MKLRPDDFIAVIAPIAIFLHHEGSKIFPSLRIAQAAHETGWTIHPWHNLVGLKVGTRRPNAYWKGAYVKKGTWEVINGERTDAVAEFRAYDSIEDCFRDQDVLFELARYDRVRAATSPIEQAHMLYLCGYATDPQYAAKLITLLDTYDLYRFDEEAEAVPKKQMEADLVLKKRIEEMQEQIEALQNIVAVQAEKIQQLQKIHRMAIPHWAAEAVEAAVTHKVIDTPESGSYDFYRMLTVLYRVGVLPQKDE